MLSTTREYLEALSTALTDETGIKVKEGKNWSVNVSDRILYYPPNELLELTPTEARGLLLHEIGHLKYTEHTQRTELQRKYPNDMQSIYNAIEDCRIEDNLISEYGEFATEALGTVADSVSDEALIIPDNEFNKLRKLNQILNALIYTHSTTTSKQRYLHNVPNKINKFYNERAEDVREAIRQCKYIIDSQLSSVSSCKQLKTFIDKQLYPILQPFIETDKPEQRPQSIPMQSKTTGGNHASTKSDKREQITRIPTDREIDGLISPYSRTLASNLNNILKEQRATRYTGAYKTGKLLNPNCYKVMTGEQRIFSKRVTPNVPDYNIIMLLDESGSMDSLKHASTYIGAYLLNKTCKALNFPITFIKYSNSSTELNSLSEYRQLDGGGTNDRGALIHAMSKIDSSRNNLILVLTDGEGGDVREILHKIKRTGTDVIGIGLGTTGDTVNRQYGRGITVDDISQLPNQLINILKSVIHR